MADYDIVRNDPNYPEPLDPEIIGLCDALNMAGFVTVSSCSGHGTDWARVHFEHDEHIEGLARYCKQAENHDYPAYTSIWEKEILLEGYIWCVTVHLWDTDCHAPWQATLKKTNAACNQLARVISAWHKSEQLRLKGRVYYLGLP